MYLKKILLLIICIPGLIGAMSFDINGKPIIDMSAYKMEKQSILARSGLGFLSGSGVTFLLCIAGADDSNKKNIDMNGLLVGSSVVGGIIAAVIAYKAYVNNSVHDATKGKTLHGAVAENNAEGVKAYIEAYNNAQNLVINEKDKNGFTPVQVAAATGSNQALQELLKGSLNYQGEYIATANSENNSITLEFSKKPSVLTPTFMQLLKENIYK